ncbi:hypothetical protein I3843_06G103200 [Carya illinoinensis]|nr:hypothetical protein I3843_06G103200 [Carya illinoinensis]
MLVGYLSSQKLLLNWFCLMNVAKTLVELGANVNAYCPGAHTGTPLYHAAKRVLKQSVKLLIPMEQTPW